MGRGAFLGLIFSWEGLYGRIITKKKLAGTCRNNLLGAFQGCLGYEMSEDRGYSLSA